MRATFGAAGDMNFYPRHRKGEPARVTARIDACVWTGTAPDTSMDVETGVGSIGDQAKIGELARQCLRH